MSETAATALRQEFPACFGEWTHEIWIGDGWLPLVRGLCRHLQALSADTRLPPVKVLQVKEKFGGLRFYVESQTEQQAVVIQFAEMLSFSTCERCGATRGVTVEGGWRKALCSECRRGSAANEHEPDGGAPR